MDNYQRTANAFHERIDCIASAVDALAPGLEAASMLLTQAVLEDRKILVCAAGQDEALARLLSRLLRDPDDRGPSFPALAITQDDPQSEDARLWRDLRTLSRDGDVLVCIDTREGSELALQCARFAAQRNLSVIALSDRTATGATANIVLEAGTRALRRELLLMATHCLLREIRLLLLGDEENT